MAHILSHSRLNQQISVQSVPLKKIVKISSFGYIFNMNIDDVIIYSILALLLYFSIAPLFNLLIAKLFWIRSEARIIDPGLKKTFKGRVFRPVFRYEFDHQEYTSSPWMPSLSHDCENNQTAVIYINPGKPQEILFPTRHDLIACILGGAGVLVIACIGLFNPFG